jgi:hypothetical protein
MADIVKKSNEAYATGLPASIRLIGYKNVWRNVGGWVLKILDDGPCKTRFRV